MTVAYRQILDDLIIAVTGLPTSGTNVEEDPAVAIAIGKVPGVVVQLAGIAPPEILGEYQEADDWREVHAMAVDVIALGHTIADRDQISAELMNAILVAFTPGRWRRYAGSSADASGEGAKRVYVCRHRFEVKFHINNTAPDILITEG